MTATDDGNAGFAGAKTCRSCYSSVGFCSCKTDTSAFLGGRCRAFSNAVTCFMYALGVKKAQRLNWQDARSGLPSRLDSSAYIRVGDALKIAKDRRPLIIQIAYEGIGFALRGFLLVGRPWIRTSRFDLEACYCDRHG